MMTTVRATGEQVDVYREHRIPSDSRQRTLWLYREFSTGRTFDERELDIKPDTRRPLQVEKKQPAPVEKGKPGRKRKYPTEQARIQAVRDYQYRAGMRRAGYIVSQDDPTIYYTTRTKRSAARERHAARHGITIKAWNR